VASSHPIKGKEVVAKSRLNILFKWEERRNGKWGSTQNYE